MWYIKGMKAKQFSPKLTDKQKLFVQHRIDNPKASATESAAQSYNITSRGSAEQIAFDNLRNPKIIMALQQHNELFESTIVNTVRDWGNEDNTRKREIATNLATWGHDKVHGKAKQQLDIHTTSVSLSLDLTGMGSPLLDPHTGPVLDVSNEDDPDIIKIN